MQTSFLRSHAVLACFLSLPWIATCGDAGASVARVDRAAYAGTLELVADQPDVLSLGTLQTLQATLLLADDRDTPTGHGVIGTRGVSARFDYTIGSDGTRRGGIDFFAITNDAGPTFCQRVSVSIRSIVIDPFVRGSGTIHVSVTGDGRAASDGVGMPFEVTGTFDGTPDTTPPTLDGPTSTAFASSAWVVASEPLPPETHAALVPEGGGPLILFTTSSDKEVVDFPVPVSFLPFGSRYTLELRPSFVDLAGNAGTVAITIETEPDPGVFAQDGFEGPLGGKLSGGAATRTPLDPIETIDGAVVLEVPPTGRFIARLAAPADATKVVARYRARANVASENLMGARFTVRAGSELVATAITLNQATFETGTPAGEPVITTVGTLELPIVLGGANEVVVAIEGVGAGHPCPTLPLALATLVDDLHVE